MKVTALIVTLAGSGMAAPSLAMPVPVLDGLPGGYLVRVHGTGVDAIHCHRAWSTDRGWHAHWRYCDTGEYNPRWRDPHHWHWQERARRRGIFYHREYDYAPRGHRYKD